MCKNPTIYNCIWVLCRFQKHYKCYNTFQYKSYIYLPGLFQHYMLSPNLWFKCTTTLLLCKAFPSTIPNRISGSFLKLRHLRPSLGLSPNSSLVLTEHGPLNFLTKKRLIYIKLWNTHGTLAPSSDFVWKVNGHDCVSSSCRTTYMATTKGPEENKDWQLWTQNFICRCIIRLKKT